ncbi:tetratricopeptide repeat protein 34 [Narcine bancroftii]|uniref:tetratricopeptide repeat protein 34 n=1 Tax=Narcine bancroftii TaxID=1343680 RepID=UPI0038320EC7
MLRPSEEQHDFFWTSILEDASSEQFKKILEIGDTTCLLSIMDIFKAEDRDLLQQHCHSSAMSILQNKERDTYVKKAVAFLSLAIIISGFPEKVLALNH